MTQITREQAQEALRSLLALEKGSYKWLENQAVIDAYIIRMDQDLRHNLIARDLAFKKCEQLEAQRQPVTDEKLREAVDSAEFAPESMFGNLVLLPKQQWDVITSALSEHASNRLPTIEEPAATLSKNALHWWMNMQDADLEEFQELPAYMQESIKRLVFYAKQRIESALPTPPAQEV